MTLRPLRPLTTLGPAAITITNCGRDVRRIFYDKLRMNGVPKIGDDGTLTIDLTRRTVSDLVLLHKTLTRVEKSAENRHDEYASDRGTRTPMTWAYEGAADGYDLKAMAKEPTPAEDWAIMRKVRKGASLTGSKWARALELMTLEATPVKDGRKLVGYRTTLPGLEETAYKVEYGTLRPAGEPHRHDEDKMGADAYKAACEAWADQAKASKEKLVGLACELLGVEDPNTRSGLPTRARDYRTDLTIRTCPVCFRDIKASDHTRQDGGPRLHHQRTWVGRIRWLPDGLLLGNGPAALGAVLRPR